MSARLSDTEKAGFVARVENQTGLFIAEVQEVQLAEPVRGGACHWCGATIDRWFCAKWCDDCLDAWLAEPKGKWANAREFFASRAAVGGHQ